MPPKYFGVKVPAECYHVSDSCKILSDDWGFEGKPYQYDTIEEAKSNGHFRPCRVCSNGQVYRRVTLNDGRKMKLTVEQLDTLGIIISIYERRGKSMSLSEIAERKNRSLGTVCVSVEALRKRGLISKEYGKSQRKAKNNSIAPTSVAKEVHTKGLAAA